MDYEIAEEPGATFALVTHTVPREEASIAIPDGLETVGQWAKDGAVSGPPLTMSRLADDGRLELRSGWHVRPDSEPPEPIELVHVPEQRAAVHLYVGAYEGLGDVYMQLWDALTAGGHQPGEWPREIYLTNPAEEPDPTKHVTRIVWPLASS